MSHLDKLQNLADSCSDIRMAIREKDITRGQGAISTLDDDIRALNPKNVVTKIYRDDTTGEYGMVQYEATGTSISDSTYNIPSGTTLIAAIYPESVNAISNETFSNKTDLQYVNLENIKSINSYIAFQDCTNLKISINMPNLTTLPASGTNRLFENSGITEVVSLGKITALSGASNNRGMFTGCSNLKKINLGDTITTIGNQTFYGCKASEIVGMSAISSLGANAFTNCTNLAIEVNLPNLTSITTSYGGSQFYNSGITKVLNFGSITTLPNGGMYQGVFNNCSSLTEVTLPSTITTIGNYTFYKCNALATLICLATTVPSLGSNQNFASTLKIYVPYSADHSILNAYKTASN